MKIILALAVISLVSFPASVGWVASGEIGFERGYGIGFKTGGNTAFKIGQEDGEAKASNFYLSRIPKILALGVSFGQCDGNQDTDSVLKCRLGLLASNPELASLSGK